MAIDFKVNFDMKAIAKKKMEEKKLIFDRAMEEAATEIVERTYKGQSADGGKFKAYSPGYKRTLRRNKEGTNVDLSRTGAMLNAIKANVRQLANGSLLGKIFVLGGHVDKARWNNPTRRFMALSKKQISELITKMKGK